MLCGLCWCAAVWPPRPPPPSAAARGEGARHISCMTAFWAAARVRARQAWQPENSLFSQVQEAVSYQIQGVVFLITFINILSSSHRDCVFASHPAPLPGRWKRRRGLHTVAFGGCMIEYCTFVIFLFIIIWWFVAKVLSLHRQTERGDKKCS